MMRNVVVAALVVLAVHASKDVQTASTQREKDTLGATGPMPFISALADSVTGNSFTFHVTFDECVEQVAPSMVTIVPSPVSVSCNALGSNQKYSCTADINQGSSVIIYKVYMADNQVSSSADSRMNVHSNSLYITYLPTFTTGALTTVPNVDPYPSLQIDYEYTYSGGLYPVDPQFVSTTTGGGPLPISYLKYDPMHMKWTFSVVGNNGGRVTTRVVAGSAADRAGNVQNRDSNSITSTISVPVPDCVVSDWSQWSTCTKTCTSYNADFSRDGGTQTRTRTIIKDPEVGFTCPPLSETQDCNTNLCFDGARPFSGEFAGECSGCTNEFGQVGQERSGCLCQAGCEATGSCCQAWYDNPACFSGPKPPQFYYMDPSRSPRPTFPLQCQPQDCRTDAIKTQAHPSYYCFCDLQCTQDFSCCGGNAARRAVCVPGGR